MFALLLSLLCVDGTRVFERAATRFAAVISYFLFTSQRTISLGIFRFSCYNNNMNMNNMNNMNNNTIRAMT